MTSISADKLLPGTTLGDRAFSVAGLPLLASGTVCLILSLPHLPVPAQNPPV